MHSYFDSPLPASVAASTRSASIYHGVPWANALSKSNYVDPKTEWKVRRHMVCRQLPNSKATSVKYEAGVVGPIGHLPLYGLGDYLELLSGITSTNTT
jgi:hypothetical protein